LAAAEAVGYDSIGVEIDGAYYRLAERAVPELAALYRRFRGETLEFEADYGPNDRRDEAQLSFALREVPGSLPKRERHTTTSRSGKAKG
jgi:hypothetical protein